MEISYMLLRNLNLKFKLRIGFMDFQFFCIEHICSEYLIINTLLYSSVSIGNLFYKAHIYTHIYIFNIIVIHTVKGFSVVKEAEVDDFLEFPCFFCDQVDVGNLILVPLPFLNPT